MVLKSIGQMDFAVVSSVIDNIVENNIKQKGRQRKPQTKNNNPIETVLYFSSKY